MIYIIQRYKQAVASTALCLKQKYIIEEAYLRRMKDYMLTKHLRFEKNQKEEAKERGINAFRSYVLR
jgi:hypothetical protein